MAFLNAIGDWLEGSGWVTIFERARMTTVGRIDSFLSGSKIKRSRYVHHVSLAALIKLARQAFEDQNEYLDYSDWERERCCQSASVSYWFTVIDLEVLLFMLIRSLREGDFPLFITSLENIVQWMFSLNHIHYARWLPVFLEDLKKMNNESNPVLEQFNKWYFSVNKTDHPFSSMGVIKHMNKTTKLLKSMVELLAY